MSFIKNPSENTNNTKKIYDLRVFISKSNERFKLKESDYMNLWKEKQDETEDSDYLTESDNENSEDEKEEYTKSDSDFE